MSAVKLTLDDYPRPGLHLTFTVDDESAKWEPSMIGLHSDDGPVTAKDWRSVNPREAWRRVVVPIINVSAADDLHRLEFPSRPTDDAVAAFAGLYNAAEAYSLDPIWYITGAVGWLPRTTATEWTRYARKRGLIA